MLRLDALAGSPCNDIGHELDSDLLGIRAPCATLCFNYRLLAYIRLPQNFNGILITHSDFDFVIIFLVDFTATGEGRNRKYTYDQHRKFYHRCNSLHLSFPPCNYYQHLFLMFTLPIVYNVKSIKRQKRQALIKEFAVAGTFFISI